MPVSYFQQAAVNASSAGANVLVAAVPGRALLVAKYKLIAAGAVSVTFESSGGTVLDGPCALAQNGGVMAPFDVNGYFQTLPGEALVLYLSGAVQVGGSLTYGVI